MMSAGQWIQQVTLGWLVYELTGGSFHDLFIASWGYEWARSQGLGRPFDLSS